LEAGLQACSLESRPSTPLARRETQASRCRSNNQATWCRLWPREQCRDQAVSRHTCSTALLVCWFPTAKAGTPDSTTSQRPDSLLASEQSRCLLRLPASGGWRSPGRPRTPRSRRAAAVVWVAPAALKERVERMAMPAEARSAREADQHRCGAHGAWWSRQWLQRALRSTPAQLPVRCTRSPCRSIQKRKRKRASTRSQC
jgi:hypothetical protein